MTLIELLLAYKRASEGVLNATEQAVYFRMVLIWNELQRPEWFSVSDPQLKREAGINSHHTVTKARRSLEDKGFIKSRKTASRRPLMYHMEMLASTAEFAVPTTAKNAVPEEQEKSLRQKLPQTTAKNAIALRQKLPHGTAKNAHITEREFTENTEGGYSQVGSTLEIHHPPEKSPPPLPDEILTAFQNKLRPLRGDEANDLAVLTEEHGTRMILKAIDKAQARGKRDLNYLKGILRSWREDDDEGDSHGQGHQAYGRHHTHEISEDPDKWKRAEETLVTNYGDFFGPEDEVHSG